MLPEKTNAGIVGKINLKQLQAFLCGLFAWMLWPDRFVDWGWGLISVLLWLAAILGILDALRDMHRAYKRDKAVAQYLKQGRQPQSSHLAKSSDLEQAGML